MAEQKKWDRKSWPPPAHVSMVEVQTWFHERLCALEKHQHQQYAPPDFQGVPYSTMRPIGFGSAPGSCQNTPKENE